jgi:hypothetical protein
LKEVVVLGGKWPTTNEVLLCGNFSYITKLIIGNIFLEEGEVKTKKCEEFCVTGWC